MGYKIGAKKYWKFIHHYGIWKKKKKTLFKKTHKFQKTPFHSSLLTRESSKKILTLGPSKKMTYET